MIRTSVYVGVSVDGYIARLDGQVDFLDSAEPIDDDMGYGEFMASIDILVMGRNTYDWVVTMIATNEDVDWPYGETPVMVLTHRALDVPPDLVDVVESTGLAPRELLAELRSRGFQHAYVDGGQTVQGFLRAGLIDELIITQVPILIGQGIPLFGEIPDDVKLHHVDTTVFDNGCIQTHYRVLPSPTLQP